MVGVFDQLFPFMFTAIFLICISTKQKPPVSHDTGGYFWVLNRPAGEQVHCELTAPAKYQNRGEKLLIILLEPQLSIRYKSDAEAKMYNTIIDRAFPYHAKNLCKCPGQNRESPSRGRSFRKMQPGRRCR